MTRNGEKMTLTLTRVEACDLMLACTLVSGMDCAGDKWNALHDKVFAQIVAFDNEYDKRRAEEAARPDTTVRGLLKMGESEGFDDIDVCDDYDERCYIAFCGGYKLTAAGEERFKDALDIEVTTAGYDADTWVLHCDTAKEANACRDLFYALAGYCGDSDFDEWFEEV